MLQIEFIDKNGRLCLMVVRSNRLIDDQLPKNVEIVSVKVVK